MAVSEETVGYRGRALEELGRVSSACELEEWRRRHLGSSGELRSLRRRIGSVAPEERKAFGKAVNEVASALESAFARAREEIERREEERRFEAEAVDVTLEGRRPTLGCEHPSQVVLDRVCEIFGQLGFEVYESPHVELDRYNFELLNMPEDHPARDMQDTFYVSDAVVLRTHTSSGQIRAMREAAPEPLRVLLPGLCYRNEAITPRSEMQFHQVEGLAIDRDIRMSDLKGVLMHFAQEMFGADQRVRFRGSYFPFTEPSVEVDIRCTLCGGKGCRLCKQAGWLELLGAGLVHPVVLRNGGYDPDEFRGLAFGMGVERLVMLLHGISDIRCFFGNDERILGQFRR